LARAICISRCYLRSITIRTSAHACLSQRQRYHRPTPPPSVRGCGRRWSFTRISPEALAVLSGGVDPSLRASPLSTFLTAGSFRPGRAARIGIHRRWRRNVQLVLQRSPQDLDGLFARVPVPDDGAPVADRYRFWMTCGRGHSDRAVGAFRSRQMAFSNAGGRVLRRPSIASARATCAASASQSKGTASSSSPATVFQYRGRIESRLLVIDRPNPPPRESLTVSGSRARGSQDAGRRRPPILTGRRVPIRYGPPGSRTSSARCRTPTLRTLAATSDSPA